MLQRSVTFYVISLAYSWGLFGFLWFDGRFENGLTSGGIIFLFLFMFGPAIGAVITALLFDRGHIKSMLGLKLRPTLWWLWAMLIPAAIILLAAWIAPFFPGVTGQTFKDGMRVLLEGQLDGEVLEHSLQNQPPFAVAFLIAVVAGAITNGILTLTEELGWRGYLWSVIRPLGFWKASLFTGVLWGVWHVPVIAAGHNYPGEPVLGPLMMIVFTIALSPVMGWLRDRSGSVLTGSIFHGVLNGTAALTLTIIATDNVFMQGIIGWPGIAVLAAVTLLLVALPKQLPPQTA